MTTRSASSAETSAVSAAPTAGQATRLRTGRLDGSRIVFWYQATRVARASACCRYRIGHLCEQLRGATAVIDHKPPARAFDGAELVVVLRPYLDDFSRKLLGRCRKRGARLVGDFDDLLFAGDPAEYPLVMSGAVSKADMQQRIDNYREGLDLFDAFTVATDPLRKRLVAAKRGARVGIVPNGLSPLWLRQGRALYPSWKPGDRKVIRFLSGSPSHDADFATIVELLADFMKAHPEVHLEIVGPLTFATERFPQERVSHLLRLPFDELPRLIASSWLTIAPLVPTEFNRCKSSIKFLESAAFGAPCIATPIADMDRHAEKGAVLLAETNPAWRHALERMLDDESRMAVGHKGQKYVYEEATARDSAVLFRHWIEQWPA
jgi:glycosyltransferase involved in cell wall biosynthesis